MRLIYCYIEDFRNIYEEEFNFSIDFECHFIKRNLSIKRRDLNLSEKFLLDNFQRRTTLIVGKTGSGKSNLLQMIGMPEEQRIKHHPHTKYFILYVDESKDNRYIAECHNIIPKGIMANANTGNIRFVRFEYKNGKITRSSVSTAVSEHKTAIVYSYDRNSVSRRLFPEIHVDGVFPAQIFFPRFTIPFENSNVGVACWFVKNMIKSLNDDNLKRDAILEILSINWNETLNVKLPDEVLSEYRFYYDNLNDKTWKSVLDVPRYIENNLLSTKGISQKEQFIHDLLTDFALYLRKWAEEITPVTESRLEMYNALGLIHNLGIDEFYNLPDGKCEDLRNRINWLCQYIDVHTDEINGNKGLLWQAGTDIIDIANLLGQFDEDCFEDGRFSFYIEDMDFNADPLKSLFERMSGYRADQLGAFTAELLPFEIKPLSSGEYQYARVLGIVNEFSSKNKIRSQQNTEPESIVLLLDEPETFMHPEMCRKLLYWIDRIITHNLKDIKVQLIMTTHSPFMLSDLMPSQIIRIRCDKNGLCRVLPKNTEFSTFAGDIHAILANDFFFDYSIGELSRKRLMDFIGKIKEIREKDHVEDIDMKVLLTIKEILPSIGDRLLRESMELMINHILDKNDLSGLPQ